MSTTYPIYIQYVFGQDSDALTPFTNATDPDGGISMDQGYTAPYQYNLTTNPEALPISRGQFNYLLNVVTANIQQWQRQALPNWIDPSQNGGVNYPYAINAQVTYGGNNYRNLAASNTAVPGSDDTWLNVSTNVDGVQVGMTIMWPNPGSPQGNYLFCDGSAVSRSTYAELSSVMNISQMGTFTVTDTTITGLTGINNIDYYVGQAVESAAFISGTTITNIISSTEIQVSNPATESGSFSIQFFQWGNGDGSTTFNLPNPDGYAIGGAGTGGLSFGSETINAVGESVGDQTYTQQLTDLPNHTHNPLSSYNFGMLGLSGSGNFNGGSNPSGQQSTTGGITGFTSQTAMPLVQPTQLYKFFVKYQ